MFKYLFQSMNEKLDEILRLLPSSNGQAQHVLLNQLHDLREISDGIIEGWLLFEEKMAKAGIQTDNALPLKSEEPTLVKENDSWPDSPYNSLQYQRGEGYFKLYMFNEACREFHSVVTLYPDFLPARLYLALCFLQDQKIADADTQLQILISLAKDGKMKAVAYNALGCVQAVKGDMTKACECFRLSHELDPNFKDPVYNLKACLIDGGVLHLGVAIG